MSKFHVIYIAPLSTDPQSSWFSPGRSKKVSQALSVFNALSVSYSLLSSAPSSNQFAQSQTDFIPPNARFLRRIFALFFSPIASNVPADTSLIIWIYNSRYSELVLAIRLLRRYPYARLIVQIEDLPFARTANSGLRGLLDLATTKILLMLAAYATAVSPSISRYLRRDFNVPPSKLVDFPPSLEPLFIKYSTDRTYVPFTNDKIHILYAGALTAEKGVDDLLWAFNQLPAQFHLHIVGAQNATSPYSFPSTSNFSYHGCISSRELYQLYSCSDIVVNPHLPILANNFVFPFKSIEQLASGSLPIFSSAVDLSDFHLPSDCLFQGKEMLLDRLLRSREIWTNNMQALSTLRTTILSHYTLSRICDSFSTVLQ